MVLISAISLIFFIKSIEGLIAKAGWAPSFSGLIKGPSRWTPIKLELLSINELKSIINNVLKSKEKTMLLAIYNNQNQRRYIGVDLN